MLGKNIKYLRLKNGFTKKALADKIGISSMSITHYENNERTPDMATIRKLMEAFNAKLTDILSVRNEAHEYIHGEFRRNSKLNGTAQEYVRENVEDYLERFLAVVEILGENALPKPPECHSMVATGDAEKDARILRSHLGFAAEGPVLNLVGAMENKGILMYITPIDSEDFSGMNGCVDGRPFIILNCNMTAERQRSTLAHELAHLFFEFGDTDDSNVEKKATAISGAFLFPKEDAYRELGMRRSRITNDMIMVAIEYGISLQMLIKRAEVVHIIGNGVYKDFMIQVSKHGWRKREPSRISAEQSHLFEQLVIRAIGEDEISVQKGAELLRISYENMTDMLRPHEEE